MRLFSANAMWWHCAGIPDMRLFTANAMSWHCAGIPDMRLITGKATCVKLGLRVFDFEKSIHERRFALACSSLTHGSSLCAHSLRN